MADDERRHYIEMEVGPTGRQRLHGKVGRNELCPCGSGKKFKRCHLRRTGT